MIDSEIECGNGAAFAVDADGAVRFEIEADSGAKDRQWFLFRVIAPTARRVTFRLTNAGHTNIPIHWKDARPVVSVDAGISWQRASGPCRVEGSAPDVYEFTHDLAAGESRIAFHHPYGVDTIRLRIDQWKKHPAVSHAILGESVQHRLIDFIRIAEGDRPFAERQGVWITSRQHAAETNASWMLEGIVEWLLSDAAADFRQRAVINIVPMINPDGVVLGNYRMNALGVNLNRVWNKPDAATSPEILHVTRAIDQWVTAGNRFDFYIDLHGDSESLACYAFQPGPGIVPPGYAEPARYHADSRRYIQAVAALSPDFNPQEGIVNTDDISLSRQYITFTYSPMAQLFENGYSFVNYGPNAGEWLTPERHRGIGRAAAEALAGYLKP